MNSNIDSWQFTEDNSPFVSFTRQCWAKLAPNVNIALNHQQLEKIRSLGDTLSMQEIQEIYLPLCRLITMYIESATLLHEQTSTFLGEKTCRTPFMIGIGGSVAVGKSTTARLLQELLSHWPHHLTVQLVTTDGFLYPNAILKRKGLMERKGFPESYDQKALMTFISQIKKGVKEVRAPWYSHVKYDIILGKQITVNQPDILIVEGLNVLANARPDVHSQYGLALSDFFDFKLYVDAHTIDIEKWYVDRFMELRLSAFNDPQSYFKKITTFSDNEARSMAHNIWKSINEVNLKENILSTRERAHLILAKDSTHQVNKIFLRKR